MRRYERASTMLISNRPVEDWGKLLGDTAAVTALLDRLLPDGRSPAAPPLPSRVPRTVGRRRRPTGDETSPPTWTTSRSPRRRMPARRLRGRPSDDSPHAVECDLVEDGGVFVAHRPSGAGPPPSQLPSSTAPYARHRTLGGVRSRAPRGSARHPGDDVLGDSPEPDLDRRRATAGRSSTTSRIAAGRSRGAALESAPDAW